MNTSTRAPAQAPGYRQAICPECLDKHRVADYDTPWANDVRDKLGHLGRGDMTRPTEPRADTEQADTRPQAGVISTSHPYSEGFKFYATCIERGYDAHVVEQEMHEQRIYYVVIAGFNRAAELANTRAHADGAHADGAPE